MSVYRCGRCLRVVTTSEPLWLGTARFVGPGRPDSAAEARCDGCHWRDRYDAILARFVAAMPSLPPPHPPERTDRNPW